MFFNGIDLLQFMRIIEIRGRGVANQELTTIRSTGASIDYITYATSPPGHIEVDFEIRAKKGESLRKKIDIVSSIIRTKERVPVIFRDEQDVMYYCALDGIEETVEYHHVGIHRGTMYLLKEEYKYSTDESILTFPTDIVVVENDGTAEALPIFELEATKKTTFAMVSNQDDEYNLVGQPADVDEQVVDLRNLIFYEHGETLDDWTTSGTAVDGTVAGSFGSDGDGITVKGYGTDTKDWHGPALIREIDPITDFEIEAMVEGRTTDVSQTFRIEFYLFDENMNQLGKMAILDRNTNINEKQAEARLGPFSGLHKNYFISSKNYKYRQDFWFGMLRMRRVGNKFDFYVTRIDNRGRHVYSLLETYIDVNNDYSGRLKYVQIHIGKYSDTERAYGPKFNRLRVYELAKETQDKTPYILYPGDILELDHVEKDIRLNGESRKDLKGSFGASFFTLKKGDNRLVVTPENSFRTRVKFRERYL